MVLHIISLGLGDAKDITVRGLELVKRCERLYLESYTAILGIGVEELENFYGKKIIVADRHMVERHADEIMRDAETCDIGFLVVGDAFAATTHHDIFLRATRLGIPVNIVHNASIMNAVACCGLQLYSFGVTVSIPFFDGEWRPYSFYDKLLTNYNAKQHTLCLVDIKVKEQLPENIAKNIEVYEPPRFMTINQAIEQLLEAESKIGSGTFTEKTWGIGLARVGQETQQIVSGPLGKLLHVDFGAPLHSLVIPSTELHPLEVEMFYHYYYDQENKDKIREEWQIEQEEKRLQEIQDRIDRQRKEKEERKKVEDALAFIENISLGDDDDDDYEEDEDEEDDDEDNETNDNDDKKSVVDDDAKDGEEDSVSGVSVEGFVDGVISFLGL